MNVIQHLAKPVELSTQQVFEKTKKTFEPTIPVIDMNEWYGKDRGSFIESLKDAFVNLGFVLVVNAPVNDDLVDKGYKTIQRCFKQDSETKKKLTSATNSGERGYVESEIAKNYETLVKDHKEFYSIGRELTSDQKQRLQYPENIWPEDPIFKETMTALYSNLEQMVSIISETISMAIDEHPSLISDMIREGDHMLRCNHYPAHTPEGQPRGSEHTDANLFTILPKATSEGLQVKLKDGTWVDVTFPENARNGFVINVGDSCQNLTNGYFRSALHRVQTKSNENERFSIAMFVHARNDDKMTPLQSCIEKTGGVRKFPNATRQELLEQHLVIMGRASKEMMERVHKSGLIEDQIQLGINCKKALDELAKNGFTYDKPH